MDLRAVASKVEQASGGTEMKLLDYDKLDPGIRETVRWLRGLGFNTTDSGDGVSKRPGDCVCQPHMSHTNQPCVACVESGVYDCWLPYANVAMVVPPLGGVAGAWDLAGELYKLGIDVKEGGPSGPSVQFTFDPADASGIITLMNVDDALLAAYRQEGQ